MRYTHISALVLASTVLLARAGSAQGGGTMAGGMAGMNNEDRKVAGGGVMIPGWTGKADAGTLTLADAKLTKTGDVMAVTTGPAVTYWNPANKATGNYTVKATFNEPKYMNLNDHPHPYGIMVAGNDLGTDQQSYLYCAAYGDGTFIVRGFAPGTPRGTFQMGGRNPTPSPAVHKAEAKDKPVTQEIAIKVSADKVDCIINGTSVASYTKAEVVGTGKLKATDGIYGIRFAHNTEATVTGLSMVKN